LPRGSTNRRIRSGSSSSSTGKPLGKVGEPGIAEVAESCPSRRAR
jgi:hypothetical protein